MGNQILKSWARGRGRALVPPEGKKPKSAGIGKILLRCGYGYGIIRKLMKGRRDPPGTA